MLNYTLMVNRKPDNGNKRISLTPSRAGLQYYFEQHLPLAYCSAVMLYVLFNSDTGQENYSKIVDTYRKPDISDMIQKLQIVLPSSSYYICAITYGDRCPSMLMFTHDYVSVLPNPEERVRKHHITQTSVDIF